MDSVWGMGDPRGVCLASGLAAHHKGGLGRIVFGRQFDVSDGSSVWCDDMQTESLTFDCRVGKMVGGQANSTQAPAFNRTETAEDLKDISTWLSTANIDADDIAAEVAERMSKSDRMPRSRVGWTDGLWAVRTIFYDDPKVRSLMFKTMGYQVRNHM
jgi:hypothetical protein